MLSASFIADLLEAGLEGHNDPLVIAPMPDLSHVRNQGGASVDLRLGAWFVTMKARRLPYLDIYDHKENETSPNKLANKYYMPFGESFLLHPRSFVLSVTLEWIRLPLGMAGMIAGKSSWGRRGLIVETAPGIQPGFTGCLTLELSNVGDIPIAIKPGTTICQLFLHKLEPPVAKIPVGSFIGQRQPKLAPMTLNDDS